MMLMLLIGVVIVAFLMVKSMTSLLQGNKTNKNNTPNVSEQGIDKNLSPIDAAKQAKDLIEQDNTKAIEQLQ